MYFWIDHETYDLMVYITSDQQVFLKHLLKYKPDESALERDFMTAGSDETGQSLFQAVMEDNQQTYTNGLWVWGADLNTSFLPDLIAAGHARIPFLRSFSCPLTPDEAIDFLLMSTVQTDQMRLLMTRQTPRGVYYKFDLSVLGANSNQTDIPDVWVDTFVQCDLDYRVKNGRVYAESYLIAPYNAQDISPSILHWSPVRLCRTARRLYQIEQNLRYLLNPQYQCSKPMIPLWTRTVNSSLLMTAGEHVPQAHKIEAQKSLQAIAQRIGSQWALSVRTALETNNSIQQPKLVAV